MASFPHPIGRSESDGAFCGLSTASVLAAGVIVTLVALLESWQRWPLAPFPLLHASLAIAVPLWLRLGPRGRPWNEIRTLLPKQGRPIAAAAAFVTAFVALYALVLELTGKGSDPSWNLIAVYREYWTLFVHRYGLAKVVVLTYFFLGLWPMIGEELFYRGFLLRGLLDRAPPLGAAAMTSAIFGLRHAAQLGYLPASYPVGSGIAYFLWAFGVSMLWCWVHIRTGSLWLCMATHSVNVVLAPIMILVLIG
jgi:membrane protease YdiL (CAAX protease family)